jgi:hypothetical protein
MTDSPTTPLRYFASYNGEVKGPFDLDMIEAFILSGHYPQDVQICAEGSNQWKSHSLAVKAPAQPLPQQQSTRPVSSKPAVSIPKWVLWSGGILGVFIVMTLMKMFTGENTPSASPRPTAYSTSAPPVSKTPYSSEYDALVTAAAKPTLDPTKPFKPVTLPKTYNSTPAPAATAALVMYKGSRGQTFSVSQSDSLRLSKQRDALTAEESAISAIQAQRDAYSGNLERERTYLDRTSQFAIDAYNVKVDNLNTANQQLRQRLAAFNRGVDAFNAELERVGTPVR